jgi:manganese efflux pump family protein
MIIYFCVYFFAMDIITLILIAIGLSVDSFAVSVSSGLILNQITFKKALRIATSLAVFQAVMPLIGWFIGNRIESYVESFDHWLAFGLLFIIGGKMIWESFKKDDLSKKINPLELKVLIGMSIATSIDALVVGVSFAFINVNLLLTALIIGLTTGFFSMLGILFGKKTGIRFGKNMEIAGGLILIFIGAKILIEHLTA